MTRITGYKFFAKLKSKSRTFFIVSSIGGKVDVLVDEVIDYFTGIPVPVSDTSMINLSWLFSPDVLHQG